MSFQNPLTIAEIVTGIESRKYLLPAIQREFVWSAEQIATLFDSLMRGYPVGSFLFWELDLPLVSKHAFFEFITHYDVRSPHNEPAEVHLNQSLTAVLDGQQRLTAFNIALRGSYTEKVPRLHRTNPKAFPKRRLHLDLAHKHDDAPPDEKVYDFEFLDADEVKSAGEDGESYWFAVQDALAFDPESTDVYDFLHNAGLSEQKLAYNNLYRLTQLIHKSPVVAAYVEKEDDLDKVLNIFIRVNSGGTKLSYADLILSVATATWKDGSAREEINDTVDELNETGQGFSFSKDRVLKSALVLGDFPDIKFKAVNFTSEKMHKVENQWPRLTSSLKTATALLSQFGLSSDTLTAENVLVPIAYYIQDRDLGQSYLKSDKSHDDRDLVKRWVLQSLLRAGFWTGAVDSILTTARTVIKSSTGGFPVDALESNLKARGKSLVFQEPEIDDLLSLQYRHRSSFLILTILYPHVDVTQLHHKDHIFPRVFFKKAALTKAGVDAKDTAAFREASEQVSNLQLLPGLPNQEKSKTLPFTWLESLPPERRDQYIAQNDLESLPKEITSFRSFAESRRKLQKARLMQLLKVEPESGQTHGQADGDSP